MRVIVCGGRNFKDVVRIWGQLDAVHKHVPITMVIDGASDDVTGSYVGVDYWAHQWALARGIPTIREHAQWSVYGKSAGPIRNAKMISDHAPDRVIAFPGGPGTKNMVTQARQANIQVMAWHNV